ncbi:CLP1-like protein [Pyrus ussuriensis x Pyrus communis]|uniref:CLP1-like protein n=1 Tax=Pyrus ussuriensis x Pyrus communis TaxID=2448454 RepID=A0A5N5GEL2_9ROSA|nr:CLP1-like protein [Pyrus ussuriensis x Pyrus communis]
MFSLENTRMFSKLKYTSQIDVIIGLDFPYLPSYNGGIFFWLGRSVTDEIALVESNFDLFLFATLTKQRRHCAKPLPPDDPILRYYLTLAHFYGPRVIVVGPTDSGKSTLSKMLLSWAAKKGWKPTFVDLDIGQGAITIPGCIATTPIEMPIDLVEGIPLDIPLIYFYGHTTPSHESLKIHFLSGNNVDLYNVLVKELAQVVERQLSGNAESRASGMVINTMGWIEGQGYELLLHAIDTFNANVVLVLGQEKLWSMIRNVVKNKPGVDVVKLQKSGGVVSRNAKFRQKSRSHRIREYFYGLANDLSPHSNIANFSDFSVFWIGGGPQAPRSALPIGAEPAADPTRLAPVNINWDLLHTILAVSFAKEPDQIISSNVAGFVFVTDVDIQRKTITYLAPSAGELPSKYLTAGTVTWLET